MTGDDRQIFPSVASQQDLTQNPRMSGAEVLGFTHHPSVLLKSSYLFWCGTTKNVCIYIYRYIICAHMYVYEYIMLNNRKKTLLAQPKRRISEARKGTCVTYLMSVWRFRMPTMVGKVNPPTDQNECQHDRFGLGESFPVLKSFI